MRTLIIFCVTLLLLAGFVTVASAHTFTHRPANFNTVDTGTTAVSKLLRLKLVIDSLNYDDIVIGFQSSASTKYNPWEDSRYLPGINAPEGLSSFSSDNVPLAINFLPLPGKASTVVRLDVEARNSGLFTLERTQFDSIPPIFKIWLIDKYKKDSLDIRNNVSYTFYINKKDTASFGNNRFTVVIRQDQALGVHLLDFNAAKGATGAEITWKTENEQNYTRFAVERSIDGGYNFYVINSFVATNLGAYNFLDKNPAEGTAEYRLQMQDMNGTLTYSKSIKLTYGTSINITNSIGVYPNPSSDIITLVINTGRFPAVQATNGILPTQTTGVGSYDIKIVNISGSIIKTATLNTSTWQDDISSLKSGTYFIQVINNNDKSVVGNGTFIKI